MGEKSYKKNINSILNNVDDYTTNGLDNQKHIKYRSKWDIFTRPTQLQN